MKHRKRIWAGDDNTSPGKKTGKSNDPEEKGNPQESGRRKSHLCLKNVFAARDYLNRLINETRNNVWSVDRGRLLTTQAVAMITYYQKKEELDLEREGMIKDEEINKMWMLAEQRGIVRKKP